MQQILVTTSRDPSSRLTQFAKEMRLVVPNSQRVNRCVWYCAAFCTQLLLGVQYVHGVVVRGSCA